MHPGGQRIAAGESHRTDGITGNGHFPVKMMPDRFFLACGRMDGSFAAPARVTHARRWGGRGGLALIPVVEPDSPVPMPMVREGVSGGRDSHLPLFNFPHAFASPVAARSINSGGSS